MRSSEWTCKGRIFKSCLQNLEAFLPGIFLAVEGQHLWIRQVGVIGDQQEAAIAAFGGLQGIGNDPPSQVDLACGRGDLHADPFPRGECFS